MKKVVVLLFALAGFAFAAEGDALSSYTTIAAFSALSAGIAIGFAALGGAVGMGNVASATISGIARNPSLGSKLQTTMFITIALIEAQVIYALVIVFMLLTFNPLLSSTLKAAAGE